MKRRQMILQGFVIALFILGVSVMCLAQTQQPPAQTQPWKLYFEGETQRYYFDPATIERFEKRIVRVWERITEKNKSGDETEKVKSHIELNCSSSKYRIIATKEYDAATKTEKPEIRSDGEPWTYFVQESVLGVLYENVCWEKTPSGKLERTKK